MKLRRDNFKQTLISLSPIYFVKIRPWFLMQWIPHQDVKTFTKLTPSKSVPFQRKWTFVVNTIFFTGMSLFTSDKKVHTWLRTHVHWFATVVLTQFSFSSLMVTYIHKRVILIVFAVSIKFWKEECTKIVNFMTPGQGSCARAWPYKLYSENALFF